MKKHRRRAACTQLEPDREVHHRSPRPASPTPSNVCGRVTQTRGCSKDTFGSARQISLDNPGALLQPSTHLGIFALARFTAV